jgi:hypothetical protein
MTQAGDKYIDLRERTKTYASRIIRLYSYLRKAYHFDDAALVIAKQLLDETNQLISIFVVSIKTLQGN